MLKASLFTLIIGLVATRLPVWVAYPALYVVPFLEIAYMVIHHQDFALHRFGLGYLSLLFVGLTSFYIATICFIAERQQPR